MKFSEMMKKYSEKPAIESFKDFEVKGLAYDSRKVKDGYIFFAIKGLKDDGNKYVNDALSNGASMVVTEENLNTEADVLKVPQIRKVMAAMSSIYYGNPSEKLKLIGVTGTNGKTTTTYLINQLLKSKGYKSGLIGTINYQIGEQKFESSLTTPDSIELNQILSQMVDAGMNYCVMEVSSIALEMDRVHGLNFDTALFTNLTSEHLDFHINMENYFNAKKILFDSLSDDSFAITNADDPFGHKILSDCHAKKSSYSVKNESDLKAYNERLSLAGIQFDVNWNGKEYLLKSHLSGRFNIYNILASVSAVSNYEVDIPTIQKELLNFDGVPGRFTKIKLPNGAIAVVDYSHTSDSLKNAIESAIEILNEENRNSRVITIFGCGGNKDKTKRPVMGNIATSLSDYAIITSDNPRFEDPYEIIDEIIGGIEKKSNYEVIENREEAIRKGIEMSGEGDIVLICGKGHETYQEVKGARTHFDDKEIVEKYLDLAK